jgi:hypothetical protein
MRKKKLKRELRVLTKRHEQLEEAHRKLALHVDVIGVAVRSRNQVPEGDLDEAVRGVHDLNGSARRAKDLIAQSSPG